MESDESSDLLGGFRFDAVAVAVVDREGLAVSWSTAAARLFGRNTREATGVPLLRLIHDAAVLICEVSDPSNTQPRLVRAGDTDEGGRGLYIVAQCCQRWGSRYGHRGKTIWTEQSLDEQGLGFLPDAWAKE